jgi:hypothetical protein
VPPPFELFPRWQLARVTTHDTHGTQHKKAMLHVSGWWPSRPSGTSRAVPGRGAAARG